MKQRDLIDRALHAFSREQWQRARHLFERAAELDALPEGVLLEVGVAELRCARTAGEARKALDLLARVPAGAPRHGEALLERVRAWASFEFDDDESLGRRLSDGILLFATVGTRSLPDEDGALLREVADELVGTAQVFAQREREPGGLVEGFEDFEDSALLHRVWAAHRAFAVDDDAPGALEAYEEALELASGGPFERPVLNWVAFFREQVRGARAALDGYEALLALVPAGEAKRRHAVERKIAQLRRGVVESAWGELVAEADGLVEAGKVEEAASRYLAFADGWTGSERARDARWHAACLREESLGDQKGAIALFSALEGEGDARARKALERMLEARLDEVERLRARGEDDEARRRLAETKEHFGLEGEGEERLVSCRRELRRRQVEDEVRGLLERGRPDEALAALEAFLAAYGQEAGARRLRSKAVAVAWHELGRPSVVLDLLEGASDEELASPELRMLVSDMVGRTASSVADRVRYGYRVACFADVVRLHRRLRKGSKERKILRQVYLDELALGWTRLLQDRIREAAHGLMREKDRGSALWGKIQDRALGRKGAADAKATESGKGGGASTRAGDRLEKELEILRAIEQDLLRFEDRTLEEMSAARYRELAEDEAGFRRFRELLDEIRPILDGFESYAEGFHVEWKDFLGSFLPGSVRDRVVDQRYLELIARQDDLLSRVRAFLRECYGDGE